MWHDPEHEPTYSQTVELDLATVAPSIAGPKRPRTHPVGGRPARGWLLDGGQPAIGRPAGRAGRGRRRVVPASDPIAIDHDRPGHQR